LGSIRHLPQAIAARLPAARRERLADLAADREVDRAYGIDTAGNLDQADLMIDNPNSVFAARYQPIRPERFAEAMSCIPGPVDGFTFIDFGSGKGRALVLATNYPFRRIVGVELCPELHAVALRNARATTGIHKHCSVIEPLCSDVLAFELPVDPLVIFMYNPFDARVMGPLRSRVEESVRHFPRQVYVVYCNPVCATIWEGSPLFRSLKVDDRFAVYTTVSAAV